MAGMGTLIHMQKRACDLLNGKDPHSTTMLAEELNKHSPYEVVLGSNNQWVVRHKKTTQVIHGPQSFDV